MKSFFHLGRTSLFIGLVLLSLTASAGRVVTDSVKSNILGATLRFNVYLPSGFEHGNQTYPVIYLLHGLSDDYRAWVQKGNMQWVADELMESGECRPTVIVMPGAGTSDINNTHCGYFNVEGWNYEDFFFQEFMPAVEKKYRIVSDKGHRALMGLSMGGGGSTVYAQRHPDMFSSSYAMSAWLNEREPTGEKNCLYLTRKSVHDHNAVGYVQNATDEVRDQLRTVHWFFDCGDDDFLFDVNVEMHKAMRQKGIKSELRIRNGVHNWEYWHTALRMALPFASRNFSK